MANSNSLGQDVASAEALAQSLQGLNLATDAVKQEAAAPLISHSFVEYQANIGCYQCYLFPPENVALDVAHCSLRVTFPRVEVVYHDPTRRHHVAWYTTLTHAVDHSQWSLEAKDDHWYLRLSSVPRDEQPHSGFSTLTQVPWQELQPAHYDIVSCRKCHTQLVTRDTIEKVLPLPSVHWMDMVDFWGAGIGAFAYMPRDEIQAQAHRVLVGESFVLLEASDVVAKALVLHDGNDASGTEAREDDAWVPLKCATCSVPLGGSSRAHGHTLRLDKHLICAHKELQKEGKGPDEAQAEAEAEDNVFATYTIDSILCATLLEHADAHGTFRFLLTSATSASPLHLQLVSWDTMIKHHAAPFRRVLKVLYGPRQATSDLFPTHQVKVPSQMYHVTVQRLEASTMLLPESVRTFHRLSVGFLYA